MRRRYPVIAALAAGLLLAACGSTEPSATEDTAIESSPSAQEEAEDEAADDGTTTAESPEDSGTITAAPDEDVAGGDETADADVGQPADPSEATRTIAVDAFDMAFDPERISVDAGEVVTFEVSNTGQAVHEFFLGDSTMQQEHADEMAAMGHDMAHDEPYSIRLDPGQTKQLTWRFAEGGEVEFACHEPGHYGAGMYGRIVVG